MTGCLAHTFGGEIPHVPGTVIKDTCLTVYIVLLGFYRIFESKAAQSIRTWYASLQSVE